MTLFTPQYDSNKGRWIILAHRQADNAVWELCHAANQFVASDTARLLNEAHRK